MKSVIELEDVSRLYIVGDTVVRALDGVSLSIEEGSFTAIMGPSGSGKSTLMSLIGCLDVPTSGQYFLEGTGGIALNHTNMANTLMADGHVTSQGAGDLRNGFCMIKQVVATGGYAINMP